MCGIVGYVGKRPCRDLLVAGLEKLEYRGYDSAGISLLSDGQIDSVRAVGNLANLRAAVGLAADTTGRRATARSRSRRRRRRSGSATRAGRPTGGSPRRTPTRTATARTASTSSSTGSSRTTPSCAATSTPTGHRFSSETDAEIVAHLIERHYDGDLTEAVRAAFAELRGHYAFVAMHAEHPETLVAARQECPLIVGLGEDETFVASAIPAFLAETRDRARAQERRDRHGRPRRARGSPTSTARPIDREVERGHLGRGRGREGRLRDLHAEGDPRAGRTRSPRRSPTGSPGSTRVDLSELELSEESVAGVRADRDRRLRDLLPRRARRPLRDRAVGAGAGRDGHRLRVPLPRPGRRAPTTW